MTVARGIAAAPVRIHVVGLIDQGMTQAAICRAADISSAYLSSLLYGQYIPGRPPQQTIGPEIAERLMAVRYEKPKPKPASALCSPGGRFEPVGYRIGCCADCGQYAPVQTRDGAAVMVNHPRAETDTQPLDAPPAAAGSAHPDCGSPRGVERHRRENTAACEPCRAARRGYEQGMTAGLAKAQRAAKTAQPVPAPLVEAVVKAMRAVVYRRPYPQLRELAATVVRIADAELAADDVSEAA